MASGEPNDRPPGSRNTEGWPSIVQEIAEVCFFRDQGLDEDAEAALRELRERFPGHPDLAAFDAPRSAPDTSAEATPRNETMAKDEDDGHDEYLAAIFDSSAPRQQEPTPPPRKLAVSGSMNPQTMYDLGIALRGMGMIDDAADMFRAVAEVPRFRQRARAMLDGLRTQSGGKDGQASPRPVRPTPSRSHPSTEKPRSSTVIAPPVLAPPPPSTPSAGRPRSSTIISPAFAPLPRPQPSAEQPRSSTIISPAFAPLPRPQPGAEKPKAAAEPPAPAPPSQPGEEKPTAAAEPPAPAPPSQPGAEKPRSSTIISPAFAPLPRPQPGEEKPTAAAEPPAPAPPSQPGAEKPKAAAEASAPTPPSQPSAEKPTAASESSERVPRWKPSVEKPRASTLISPLSAPAPRPQPSPQKPKAAAESPEPAPRPQPSPQKPKAAAEAPAPAPRPQPSPEKPKAAAEAPVPAPRPQPSPQNPHEGMAVLGVVAITRRSRLSVEAAVAAPTRDQPSSEPRPEPLSAKNVAFREQDAVPHPPGEAAETLAAVEEIVVAPIEDDDGVVVRARTRPRRLQIAVVGGSLLVAVAAVAWLYPREETPPELETDPPVAAVAAAPLPPEPETVAAQPPAVEPEPPEDLETEPLALELPPPTDEVDTATPQERRRSKRRRRRTRPEVEEPEPPPAEATSPAPKPKPEPPPSAAELLKRARASYASGDIKSAFRLAKRSYEAAPSHAALELMALSACRDGKGDAALSALRRLPLGKRTKVRRACRKHGNPIPLT